jgi:hypothetical protein
VMSLALDFQTQKACLTITRRMANRARHDSTTPGECAAWHCLCRFAVYCMKPGPKAWT